jgi:hypothetical protein
MKHQIGFLITFFLSSCAAAPAYTEDFDRLTPVSQSTYDGITTVDVVPESSKKQGRIVWNIVSSSVGLIATVQNRQVCEEVVRRAKEDGQGKHNWVCVQTTR